MSSPALIGFLFVPGYLFVLADKSAMAGVALMPMYRDAAIPTPVEVIGLWFITGILLLPFSAAEDRKHLQT